MNIIDILYAKKLSSGGGGGGGGGDIPIASVMFQNNMSVDLYLQDYFLTYPVVNSETGVIECPVDDNLPVIDALDSTTFNMVASPDNHLILKFYGYENAMRCSGDCVIEASDVFIAADIFGDCTIIFEVDG